MINNILKFLLEVTISSSVLILLLLLFRKVFKNKISPRLQYAAWLLVVVRLLVPFSIQSPTSVMNIFKDTSEYIDKQITELQQNPNQTQIIQPKINADTAATNVNPTATNVNPTINTLSEKSSDTYAYNDSKKLDIMSIVIIIWLSGVLTVLSYFILINLRFKRKVEKQAFLLSDIECRLPVYMMRGLPSPCLSGIISPKILITPKVLENNTMKYVLAHELCHFKQKDNWAALLRNICCMIYWFNPLVWYAAALSKEDCEILCDSKVIKYLGEAERISYGEALIAIIQRERVSADMLTISTSMAAGKNKIKERINMIAKHNKALKTTIIFAVIILVIISAFTLTGIQKGSAVKRNKDLNLPISTSDIQTDNKEIPQINIPTIIVEPEKTLAAYFKSIGYNAKLVKKDNDVQRGSQNGLLLVFDLGDGISYQATVFSAGKDKDTWEITDSSFINPKGNLLIALIEQKLDAVISMQKSNESVHNKNAFTSNTILELARYGEPAYEYLIGQFKNAKAKGIRGDLMAKACIEILGDRNNVPQGWKSGEEWYAQLKPLEITPLPPVIKPTGITLEELATSAALENYIPNNKYGVVLAAPYVFDKYEEGDTLTIWATVYYKEFHLYGKKLVERSAGLVPAAIKLHKDSKGSYSLKEYIKAGDGSGFIPSIKEFCKEKSSVASKMIKHYGSEQNILSAKIRESLINYLKANKLEGIYLEDRSGKQNPLT